MGLIILNKFDPINRISVIILSGTRCSKQRQVLQTIIVGRINDKMSNLSYKGFSLSQEMSACLKFARQIKNRRFVFDYFKQ